MKKMDTRNSGFSLPIVLIAVAAVVAIGVVAGVVYKDHHHKTTTTNISASTPATSQPANKSTTKSTNQTTQPAQTTPTLTTYTSTSGGFTFQYPSNWKVTDSQINSSDQIYITPATSGTTTVNGESTVPDIFNMTFFVSTGSGSNYQPPAIPYGTVQALSNGINLWTSGTAHSSYVEHSGTTVSCPTMEIVNSNSTQFSAALPNGKYLVLNGNYCGSQGSVIDQTYQQQLASSDWQSGVAIVQSIKFQ